MLCALTLSSLVLSIPSDEEAIVQWPGMISNALEILAWVVWWKRMVDNETSANVLVSCHSMTTRCLSFISHRDDRLRMVAAATETTNAQQAEPVRPQSIS